MLDGLRRSVIIADPKLTCGRFPEQRTKMSTVRITKMGYCSCRHMFLPIEIESVIDKERKVEGDQKVHMMEMT